jgi:excisionase family DNA binding protein
VKTRTIVELPGYVTVAVAADRLKLAPRTVRDLVYGGRLPSARLGRRHFLKTTDVEGERRRRLGLPLLQANPVARRRRSTRPTPLRHAEPRAAAGATRSDARRERAAQRAAALEHWLRSHHSPVAPSLPFERLEVGANGANCDACKRPVRSGGQMLQALPETDTAARLCLTCGRRALLAWSDARRREALAARRFAQELGTTYAPLLEPVSAAA